MVMGYASDFASAHEIQTAIPDVRIIKTIPQHSRCRRGCAHTSQVRVFVRVLHDPPMRLLKSSQQRQRWIISRRSGIAFLYGFDCKVTGFLTAFVPTHPVRDDDKLPLAFKFLALLGRPIRVVVLVLLPLASDVAEAGDFQSFSNGHKNDDYTGRYPFDWHCDVTFVIALS